MDIVIEKIWLLPFILALVVVFGVASANVGLFPVPYYLGLAIPYLVVGNLGLIAYIAVKHKNRF